jgi:hypothetical protein
MSITKFRDVDKAFFETLIGVPNFTLAQAKVTLTDDKNTSFDVPVRSTVKSKNLKQVKDEEYPCIIVQRDSPKIMEIFMPDVKPFYAALRKSTPDAEYKDVITQFFEPVPMEFRYEVSVCTKDYDQYNALCQWALKNYNQDSSKTIAVNKTFEAETVFGTVSDAEEVDYDFSKLAEPERSDGVMETIYEFILYPYIILNEPVDLDAIRNVVIGLKAKTP